MRSKKLMRRFIASLPVVGMLDTALDAVYISAKIRRNYIDQLVSHPKFGLVEGEELDELHYKAIKKAFIHHYNNCKFYHDYCRTNGGVKPDDIHSIEDVIKKIPQIPAETFKQGGIMSIAKKKVKTVVTTSGTRSNNPSYLIRDNKSVMRFGKIVVRTILNVWYPEVIEMQSKNKKEVVKYALNNWAFGFFMPPPWETSTWMTQSMVMLLPLFDLLHINYEYYLKGFEFDEEKALNMIKEQKKGNKMLFLWGFHYILEKLMQYMDKTGERLELDPDGEDISFIMIGGGWKTLTGEMIEREKFEDKLVEYFGVNKKWIVDFYGLGEVNTGALDICRFGKKHHLLPNARAICRDPETLEPCAEGEKGLLSIYDPGMNCYPAFVISDDLARITEPQKCECGFYAQDLKLEGRAPNAELRSCGLKMQQVLTDENKRELEMLRAKTLREGIGF